MRHALDVAQHALNHLLQIALALAQIGIVHFIELARDYVELRSQRPLDQRPALQRRMGVVEPVFDPMGDTVSQHFVFQEHQMHFQNRAEFRR